MINLHYIGNFYTLINSDFRCRQSMGNGSGSDGGGSGCDGSHNSDQSDRGTDYSYTDNNGVTTTCDPDGKCTSSYDPNNVK